MISCIFSRSSKDSFHKFQHALIKYFTDNNTNSLLILNHCLYLSITQQVITAPKSRAVRSSSPSYIWWRITLSLSSQCQKREHTCRRLYTTRHISSTAKQVVFTIKKSIEPLPCKTTCATFYNLHSRQC